MSITAIPPVSTSVSNGPGAATAAAPTQTGTTISALANAQPSTSQTSAQTPQAVAVGAAALVAAVRQSGLATLMADLSQALANPATPAPVQAAASQVLALRTPLDPPPSGADLQQAAARSGLFLEANLAAGAAPAADIKAALLVVRQVLNTWSDSVAGEPAVSAQTAQNPNPQTPSPQSPAPPSGLVETSSGSAGSNAGGDPNLGSQSSPQAPSAAASPEQPAVTPSPAANPSTLQQASEAGVSASGTPAAVEPDNLPSASTPPPQGAAPTASQNAPASPPGSSAAVASDPPAPNPPQAPTSAATPPAPGVAVPAPAGQVPQAISGAVLAALAAAPDLQDESETAPPASAPTAGASPTTQQAPSGASLAPPFRDGPTAAQPPAAPTLAANAEPAIVARQLLSAADGAVARQELHQIASLPDAAAPQAVQASNTGPRWMFELPFSTPQGSTVAQFEISRDGGRVGVAEAQSTWRARFSIDVEPMGPVHAQVALTGARAGVTLWAERPETARRLRDSQDALAQSLEGEAFSPAVAVHIGQPPRAAPAAGRFLDQAS
ncbi:MAG TPA: flagellar hook-length control protein FliK [Caulobacteraceae bacterium]|nr:flagellar hook-length control protein FliK [Caulobacteraceae bacterium]